jgi:hypothetical protein
MQDSSTNSSSEPRVNMKLHCGHSGNSQIFTNIDFSLAKKLENFINSNITMHGDMRCVIRPVGEDFQPYDGDPVGETINMMVNQL